MKFVDKNKKTVTVRPVNGNDNIQSLPSVSIRAIDVGWDVRESCSAVLLEQVPCLVKTDDGIFIAEAGK